jgi:VanZ family protein
MVEGTFGKEACRESSGWVKTQPVFMKWITTVFALFILAVILLADLGMLPRYLHALYDFPFGDKFGHLILYGLLDFLLTLTLLRLYPNRNPKSLAFRLGLILAVLIGLEEFSQSYLPSRTSDWIDLLASYLGLILGGLSAIYVKK